MIEKQGGVGFQPGDVKEDETQQYEQMKEKVTTELRRTFRPEFLNRVDETIVFHSLNQNHIQEIVELMLQELQERLKEQNLELEVTPQARNHLAQEGFDRQFGARPLRRTIQRLIEHPLADKVLGGEFQPGDTIRVGVSNSSIYFDKKTA